MVYCLSSLIDTFLFSPSIVLWVILGSNQMKVNICLCDKKMIDPFFLVNFMYIFEANCYSLIANEWLLVNDAKLSMIITCAIILYLIIPLTLYNFITLWKITISQTLNNFEGKYKIWSRPDNHSKEILIFQGRWSESPRLWTISSHLCNEKLTISVIFYRHNNRMIILIQRDKLEDIWVEYARLHLKRSDNYYQLQRDILVCRQRVLGQEYEVILSVDFNLNDSRLIRVIWYSLYSEFWICVINYFVSLFVLWFIENVCCGKI